VGSYVAVRGGQMVAKMLLGTKPIDIPVEQLTRLS
jgi:hypothetical protein